MLATINEFFKASQISLEAQNALYHLSENPSHANGISDLLNEKITKITIGIYKKK